MSQPLKPRLLCVDDDPALLEGLELSLHRHFEVSTALNAEQALGLLWQAPYPVILSDMRMPGMDGAALLAQVREQFPDTVRLLLTGYADMEAAAKAVNEGQIFRFLIKPCRPEVVLRAALEALHQHRLVTAEHELLERTLRGAVQALTEVLSLADPVAYTRAARVQKLATALAQQVRLKPLWPLELASRLAPLGRVSLPAELLHREHQGEPLSREDRQILERVPEVTERLLAPIPRLEPVREILRIAASSDGGGHIEPSGSEELQMVLRSARILRLASDFEDLHDNGEAAAVALAELHGRKRYDTELLTALEAIQGTEAAAIEIRSLPALMLKPGMVLVDDLYTSSGQRLVPRGFEVNAGFVERMQNLRRGSLREPVRVMLPH